MCFQVCIHAPEDSEFWLFVLYLYFPYEYSLQQKQAPNGLGYSRLCFYRGGLYVDPQE